MSTPILPLWECTDCGHVVASECLAGDDWPDGVLRGVGPDCPECDCRMDCIGEGHIDGDHVHILSEGDSP